MNYAPSPLGSWSNQVEKMAALAESEEVVVMLVMGGLQSTLNAG